MTTLADLRTRVRRRVRDFPKVRIDKIDSYNGSDNPLDMGKDLGIETNSETFSVNGVLQTRTVDYTFDFDANQITLINLPAAGTALRCQYKECRHRTELIDDAINEGRKMLWRRFYKIGFATITIASNKRDYVLTGTDVNEVAMRAVFTEGHGFYLVFRADYQPNGVTNNLWVPERRFEILEEGKIHLYPLLPVGSTLRLHVAYAFLKLVAAGDVADFPDQCEGLVVDWAVGELQLGLTPGRVRQDTQNTFTGPQASSERAQSQAARDFIEGWLLKRNSIGGPAFPAVETRDVPRPWMVGLGRYR